MPRLWRGAFFSHHTYISVKNKGRFGKSKSHSCPFIFSKICPEKYIVFVTTHKKWERASTAALIYLVYLTFTPKSFIMAFVESTVRVEFPGSVIAHLLCRRCTVKKTVACYPASAERKVNVEPSREIYFSGRWYIRFKKFFGLRLSAGFLSKHGTSSVTERSEPSAANRWLTECWG